MVVWDHVIYVGFTFYVIYPISFNFIGHSRPHYFIWTFSQFQFYFYWSYKTALLYLWAYSSHFYSVRTFSMTKLTVFPNFVSPILKDAGGNVETQSLWTSNKVEQLELMMSWEKYGVKHANNKFYEITLDWNGKVASCPIIYDSPICLSFFATFSNN